MAFTVHSRYSDAEIKALCEKNPIREIKDAKGNPTNILNSGLVRLDYPHLFQPQDNSRFGKEPRYSVVVLWAECVDTRPMKAVGARLVAQYLGRPLNQVRPEAVTMSEIIGLKTPWSAQGSKMNEERRTAGGWMATITNKNAPGVFERAADGKTLMRCTREKAVYPGVWGTVLFELYVSKANPQAQIPARLCASLRSVSLLRPDEQFPSRKVIDPEIGHGLEEGYMPIETPDDLGHVQHGEAGSSVTPDMLNKSDEEWLKELGL